MWNDQAEGLLFWQSDTFNIIEQQKRAVAEAVERVPEQRLREAAADTLADELARSLTIDVPKLSEAEITVSLPKEVEITVRGRTHGFYGFDGERTIKGTRIVFRVPFTGDPVMFSVRPSSFTLNPPRAEIGHGVLEKPFEAASLDQATVKREFEEFLRTVKENLVVQERDVAQFNVSLKQGVFAQISERKSRLQKGDALVSGLGYKVQ
jgi:hypothetical protein